MNNKKYFYKRKGQGPVLLFLHGFLESSKIWEEISEELHNNYTIITPDLLGHGENTTSSLIHTMEDMAKEVVEILHKENITKCAVIGHSMGGYVALAIAELFPEYLTGILLLNSTAESDSNEKKIHRERVNKAVIKDKNTFINLAVPSLFTPENQKKYAEEIQSIIKQAQKMKPEGIIAASQGMKIRPNRQKMLQKLNITKHFIFGKFDALMPTEKAIEQATEVGASYIFLESGHMSYIERKDETITSIITFAKLSFLNK